MKPNNNLIREQSAMSTRLEKHPDEIYKKIIKLRAQRHRRSMDGRIRSILFEATSAGGRRLRRYFRVPIGSRARTKGLVADEFINEAKREGRTLIVSDTNLLIRLYIESAISFLAREVMLREDQSGRPGPMEKRVPKHFDQRHPERARDLAATIRIMNEAESMMLFNEHDVPRTTSSSLAASSECSAYDAEFVVLARELRVPLVRRTRSSSRSSPMSLSRRRSCSPASPWSPDPRALSLAAERLDEAPVRSEDPNADVLQGHRRSSRAQGSTGIIGSRSDSGRRCAVPGSSVLMIQP